MSELGAAKDQRTPDVVLDSPVEGEWLVLRPPGHAPYALDFVGLHPDTGRWLPPARRYWLARARADEVPGWERGVFAPCAGRVVVARDGMRDRERLVPPVDLINGFVVRPVRLRHRKTEMAGNHIVLAGEHGWCVFAHLRRGTVQVRVGEEVEAGTLLGLVGNSGNSVAPHLHFQLQGAEDPIEAPVLRFRLRSYERWEEGRWVEVQSSALRPGARVRLAPAP